MEKPNKFYCKLTTPELQKRKTIFLSGLKMNLIEKRELENGYAYRFPDSDEMLDELLEFIKAERKCCEFFNFKLLVNNETEYIWLELTGGEGVKEFI